MTQYPDDADGAVLADLASQGVDLSQPLVIEFAIDAPDESSAEAIRAALQKSGYESEVYYDEGEADEESENEADDEEFGPSWTVNASVRMIPAYKEIVRLQAEFDRIALPHGGRSDGWGVMVGG